MYEKLGISLLFLFQTEAFLNHFANILDGHLCTLYYYGNEWHVASLSMLQQLSVDTFQETNLNLLQEYRMLRTPYALKVSRGMLDLELLCKKSFGKCGRKKDTIYPKT